MMSMVKLENYGIVDTASTTPLRYIQLTHKGSIIELWVFEESGRLHAWAERNDKYDRLGGVKIVNSEDPDATKKYYIKLKGLIESNSYINLHSSGGVASMGTKRHTDHFKTQFTKQDIEDYGLQKFADSELFELVEVDE